MIYLDKNHCFVSGDGFQDLDLFFPALPGQAQRIFMSSSRDVDLNLRNLLRSPSGAVAPSSRRAAWKKGSRSFKKHMKHGTKRWYGMIWFDMILWYIYIYVTFRYCKSGKSGTHFCVQNLEPQDRMEQNLIYHHFPSWKCPSRAIDPPLSQRLTKNSPPIIWPSSLITKSASSIPIQTLWNIWNQS